MKSSLFDTNIADPLVAMRKAYTFGCEGLKLFIDDETSNEEKIEVYSSYAWYYFSNI